MKTLPIYQKIKGVGKSTKRWKVVEFYTTSIYFEEKSEVYGVKNPGGGGGGIFWE